MKEQEPPRTKASPARESLKKQSKEQAPEPKSQPAREAPKQSRIKVYQPIGAAFDNYFEKRRTNSRGTSETPSDIDSPARSVEKLPSLKVRSQTIKAKRDDSSSRSPIKVRKQKSDDQSVERKKERSKTEKRPPTSPTLVKRSAGEARKPTEKKVTIKTEERSTSRSKTTVSPSRNRPDNSKKAATEERKAKDSKKDEQPKPKAKISPPRSRQNRDPKDMVEKGPLLMLKIDKKIINEKTGLIGYHTNSPKVRKIYRKLGYTLNMQTSE
mmetsp:Transcript_26105/g.39901  ORF Transcript_26105/g.39901 Transcript_26105/m.39901 type:complete len:269 (-) Transcript_26105:264-1070(-)